MDSGLSPQDKKDLDKFIKFFALKVRSQVDDLLTQQRSTYLRCSNNIALDLPLSGCQKGFGSIDPSSEFQTLVLTSPLSTAVVGLLCPVLQTVQVIVQARLGEKICTRSSSSPTGSDWVILLIYTLPAGVGGSATAARTPDVLVRTVGLLVT